ncbi:hypothetical protein Poli38472_006030 [Pythium oligandrum]|uniref:Sulfhydryl oxidase n=1 Tax=Pythium oligandrum TaxID=41045 RepID=A0A8K1CTM7_PYTOL|nr:hypothetical protein Poli38472_006030 [Pythium oligandrum]|eukprot:TMW68562.1 hypothetical protein Poli38472_006030 [Pythium oligandrum]
MSVKLWIVASVVSLLTTATHAMFKDSKPLFKDSFHVRSLTDEAFDEAMSKTDQVWVVDFYAPWCPHCRDFAPELEKIAAFYADSKVVHVGAVDCTTSQTACNKEEIMAYPSIKIFHVPATASKGKKFTQFGRKNMKSVVKWVEDLLEEAQMKSGISADNVDQQIELIRNDRVSDGLGLPQERSLKMKYARLQDAGSAAIFTLENSLFIGKSTLDGERYEAALKWIEALAASFPLERNRAVFRDLADAMQIRESWDQSAWNSLIRKWKAIAMESTFPKTLLVYDEEATWAQCNTYTCGLWTLFHSMSVEAASPTCPLKPSQLGAAIRLFVMHFFGCEECVKHFLMANPPSVIDELAKSDSINNHALLLWLWRMHNKVNRVTKKAFWPSIGTCPICFADNVRVPSLDPAQLREDEVAAYVTAIYQHQEADVWSMNYENNGVRAILSDSFNGFSSVILVVGILGVFIAATQKQKLSALSDFVLKREHAA